MQYQIITDVVSLTIGRPIIRKHENTGELIAQDVGKLYKCSSLYVKTKDGGFTITLIGETEKDITFRKDNGEIIDMEDKK